MRVMLGVRREIGEKREKDLTMATMGLIVTFEVGELVFLMFSAKCKETLILDWEFEILVEWEMLGLAAMPVRNQNCRQTSFQGNHS